MNRHPRPTRRARIALVVLGTLAGLVAVSSRAVANVVTFDFAREFSAATSPAGAAPWLIASFDDSGTAGSVGLTISSPNLVGSEFVTGWYFNIAPFIAGLSITQAGAATVPQASGISVNENNFKADGDGYFDILISFGNGVFTKQKSAEFDILGTDIVASSFSALSGGAGNSKDGLFVAAHVQSIDDEYSGWVTVSAVPLPPALALFASALAGMAAVFRRRRKAA